jgi:hypothetical protein
VCFRMSPKLLSGRERFGATLMRANKWFGAYWAMCQGEMTAKSMMLRECLFTTLLFTLGTNG